MSDREIEQVLRPEQPTARAFLFDVLQIILYLAAAQIAANILTALTDSGIFNLLLYALALVLILSQMHRMVASTSYMIRGGHIILSRRLGEITIFSLDIPLDQIITVREHLAIEDLSISYHQVTNMEKGSRTPIRVRLAFFSSLFSSRVARRLAGHLAERPCGYALIYWRRDKQRACIFCPDASFLCALQTRLGDRYALDDRLAHPRLTGLRARALEHAFPQFYPFVQPLITDADESWAIQREQQQKERRQKRAAEAERRRKASEASRARAEADREKRARQAAEKKKHKQMLRENADPDLLPEERPREMEIPEHPEIVTVPRENVTLEKSNTGKRRRSGSREEEHNV